jgi:hypothetical protein
LASIKITVSRKQGPEEIWLIDPAESIMLQLCKEGYFQKKSVVVCFIVPPNQGDPLKASKPNILSDHSVQLVLSKKVLRV